MCTSRCASEAHVWGRTNKVSGAIQGGPKPATTGDKVHPDSARLLACCGQPMEPRLAHALDRYGQAVFVAVWRCPACGRITY